MKKEIVFYYSDELNDDVLTPRLKRKTVDENYKYVHTSLFKKITSFFWYRIVAVPIAFIYMKLKFHHKIVNKRILRKYKGTGYFVYGNHTQEIGDAFIANLISLPKRSYIVVHPDNISLPVIGKITPSLGALPLPDNMAAMRSFNDAIEKRITKGCAVAIYPEAHVWPYYTKIRPFTDASFTYPIKLGVPTFSFTSTYQKRRLSKKPKIVTYIDGPFYPSESSSIREKRASLRNLVYDAMCARAESSSVEVVKYVKRDK